MSHKKINKKKQEVLLKKQKQQKMTAAVLVAVVVAACAGGLGWLIYDHWESGVGFVGTTRAEREAEAERQEELAVSREETNSSTVNVDSILDYLSGLDTELLNEEIAPEYHETTKGAVSSESVSGE